MLELQRPELQGPEAQKTKGTNWPLFAAIGLACVGGLVGLVVLSAFFTGFMNGYNGARYRGFRARGNAFYSRGDYAHAAAEYAQMVAVRPDAPNGYRFHGDADYKMGNYTASIADYSAALQHCQGTNAPYRSHVFFNRGNAYGARQEYPLAVADYTTALGLDPTNTDALRARVWAYRQARNFSHALQDADTLIAPRPMGADGYLVRAYVWQSKGDHARAAADFRSAMRLSPEDREAYESLAQMYDGDGKDAEAARAAQAELQALPNNAPCWGNLGWYQYRAGDVATAIASNRHALGLDNRLTDSCLNLGLCYAVVGDLPRAQQCYASVLPNCSPADVRAGENDLREALKQHPHTPTIQQALTMLMQK